MSEFQPVVLSGPSGGGKSTLLKMLMAEFKDCFAFSVSHTTRKPRPGEEDGKDYHFVSREAMVQAINEGEFLEHAEFSGNMYGTSKKAVKDVISSGKICVLDVEINGVKNIKKTDLNARYIFIQPPNEQILEERLRGRGTETEDSLQKRLATAKEALEFSRQPGVYNHIIINDDKEEAYKTLRDVLIDDLKKIQSGASS